MCRVFHLSDVCPSALKPVVRVVCVNPRVNHFGFDDNLVDGYGVIDDSENYDLEKEQKAAAEELAKAVKEVVDKGSELIKKGFAKEEVMAVVGKHNNGNSNPSSIKSIEICAAVMAEFAELEKTKASKKSTTPKGETK